MSSRRQGLLPKLSIPAGLFRQGINLWPPFMGAGIRVTRRGGRLPRRSTCGLTCGVLNRNYFGTQFGGSVYAMTDPFFALMMLRNLGPDYVVWDKAGCITTSSLRAATCSRASGSTAGRRSRRAHAGDGWRRQARAHVHRERRWTRRGSGSARSARTAVHPAQAGTRPAPAPGAGTRLRRARPGKRRRAKARIAMAIEPTS